METATPSDASKTNLAGSGPLLLNACCLDCGYRLHGLQSSICPECGRAFDPADSGTYGLVGLLGSIQRYHRRPPGLVHVAIVALCLVLLLDASSRLLADATTLQVAISFVVLLVSMNEVAVRALVVRDQGLRKGESRRAWRWFAAPLACAMAVMLMVSDWPVRARFALSRPQFDRVVAQVRSGTVPSMPMWIGLYRVDAIEVDPSAVWFITDDHGSGPKGFEYRTGDPPDRPLPIKLGGSWTGGMR